MKLDKLFKQIEGIDFTTSLSVISGFSAFQRALDADPTLNSLVDDMQKTLKHRQAVTQRIVILLSEKNASEFEHPHDIALSAYLFALNKVNPATAHTTAQAMLEVPNLGWAQRLASLIVGGVTTAPVQAVQH